VQPTREVLSVRTGKLAQMARSEVSAVEWDVVVVAVGSAGCVLADRLSRNRHATVFVLEPRGVRTEVFVRLPAGLAKISESIQ
jgi:choline dehydrogenase-like flavoprotein